jgi:hypothetical protein
MEPANPYASPHEAGAGPPPPRPPDTFLEIIATGISLYIGNAPAIVVLVVLIMGPMELMQSYYDYFIRSATDIGGALGASFWIKNIIGILPTAGIVAIGDAAMRGQRPTVWFGLRAGLEAWPRMILTRIIVSLITLLGLVAFIIPGVYFGIRSGLAELVIVIERANSMPAIQRSFELTLGRFWCFFLLSSAVVAFMFVLGVLTQLPSELFPERDHWILTASLSLLVDVLAGLPVLVFVAGYWASAHAADPRVNSEPTMTPDM